MKHNPNPELIDDENPEWTDVMLKEAKTATELFPQLLKNNNATASVGNKIKTTVFFDADIVSAFRMTGNDWQVRMNNALREWLTEHAL
jgi:uncharacterized protein (DUF4415 family)